MNMLTTPENYQIEILLNLVKKEIRENHFSSDRRWSIAEKIYNKFIEDSEAKSKEVNDKFDTSLENCSTIFKKSRDIIDNYFIEDNKLINNYLETSMEKEDLDYIFDYNNLMEALENHITKIKKTIRGEEKSSIQDLSEKSRDEISKMINIPKDELDNLSMKETCELMFRHMGIDPNSSKYKVIDELDVDSRNQLIENLKDRLNFNLDEKQENNKESYNNIGDNVRVFKLKIEKDENENAVDYKSEEIDLNTGKIKLPEPILNHIMKISNITDEEKCQAIDCLSNYIDRFTPEFLEEFENSDFQKQNMMIENILKAFLIKSRNQMTETLEYLNKTLSDSSHMETVRESKELFDEIYNFYQNLSEEEKTKFKNGELPFEKELENKILEKMRKSFLSAVENYKID